MPVLRTVVVAHVRSYDAAIVVAKGDKISVGRRDGRWPEWLWCTAAGVSGWLHESVVEFGDGGACAARDFDNGELTVSVGDRIRAGERLGDWIWCLTDDGRSGWVPEACLA